MAWKWLLILSPVLLALLLRPKGPAEGHADDRDRADCIYRLPRDLQNSSHASLAKNWCPPQEEELDVSSFTGTNPRLRRVLVYLQCPWSLFSSPGFEKLKMVAQMVPEDITVVSVRVDGFAPSEDRPFGKFFMQEVRAGRMIDTFTKYRATLLFVEDGAIIAMRLNIAQMEDDCLRREVLGLWNVPRDSTGFVRSNQTNGTPDFLRRDCYL